MNRKDKIYIEARLKEIIRFCHDKDWLHIRKSGEEILLEKVCDLIDDYINERKELTES